MRRQFDVHRLSRARTAAVIIESDLLEDSPSRVIIPLIEATPADRPPPHLNPVLTIDDRPMILLTQQIGSVRLDRLGPKIATAAAHRDAITRAIDILIAGV